jgi:hypothetical protein
MTVEGPSFINRLPKGIANCPPKNSVLWRREPEQSRQCEGFSPLLPIALSVQTTQNRVYPSSNRILLNLPVLADYVESGLATYKIQVKKYYPLRKSIITEPAYSLKVEVG